MRMALEVTILVRDLGGAKSTIVDDVDAEGTMIAKHMEPMLNAMRDAIEDDGEFTWETDGCVLWIPFASDIRGVRYWVRPAADGSALDRLALAMAETGQAN